MGLAIQVGILADLLENDPEGAEWLRESLDAVNDLLRQHKLPIHREPETIPPLSNRCHLDSYPYSFIHYLRRAYAHRRVDPKWTAIPLPRDAKPTEDPVLKAQYQRNESHLICHSDAEGFYVPIDFAAVLIDKTGRVPGAGLGSSQRLMQELGVAAPAIGIGMAGPTLSDGEAAAINDLFERESGLYIEQIVWLSLYEAARLSIQYRAAICFT